MSSTISTPSPKLVEFRLVYPVSVLAYKVARERFITTEYAMDEKKWAAKTETWRAFRMQRDMQVQSLLALHSLFRAPATIVATKVRQTSPLHGWAVMQLQQAASDWAPMYLVERDASISYWREATRHFLGSPT